MMIKNIQTINFVHNILVWSKEEKKFCTHCKSVHDTFNEATAACQQDVSCDVVYDLFCDDVAYFCTCSQITLEVQTHPKGIDCIYRKLLNHSDV